MIGLFQPVTRLHFGRDIGRAIEGDIGKSVYAT